MTRRTNSTTKVKVEREQLLVALRTRREVLVTAHEKASSRFASDMATYRTYVVRLLVEQARAIEEGGELPDRPYRGVLVATGVPEPREPELHLTALDQIIAALDMSADEAIVLTDDIAGYLA